MLFFVIYGIIKNVLPNFYFILQIYQVKSFKMMHFMSQYFNFSIRYSWKCSKKLIELRLLHCNPVQGQYRARTGFSLCSKFSQGKTCFYYREPLFSLQGPCIRYREFPVRITTQGNPCSHYREWVCSVSNYYPD